MNTFNRPPPPPPPPPILLFLASQNLLKPGIVWQGFNFVSEIFSSYQFCRVNTISFVRKYLQRGKEYERNIEFLLIKTAKTTSYKI